MQTKFLPYDKIILVYWLIQTLTEPMGGIMLLASFRDVTKLEWGQFQGIFKLPKIMLLQPEAPKELIFAML